MDFYLSPAHKETPSVVNGHSNSRHHYVIDIEYKRLKQHQNIKEPRHKPNKNHRNATHLNKPLRLPVYGEVMQKNSTWTTTRKEYPNRNTEYRERQVVNEHEKEYREIIF
ncbi:hypothetical protein [Burkholderia sp. 9779_493]|uniref:hypothetical protein n=1 Tax=Burkholderia sp. 9779_493 TaxID=2751184 RepID=UPI0018C43C20|nr:hypothetical protein [Burkholderia sp. 9779_493]MBG0865450.1 hypothetical protein [Burkholderia sp. 9779_493]